MRSRYTQLGDKNFNVARFYVTIEDVTPETYTVEYKWVTGSEKPVDLPTAQTNLESLTAVNVDALPTGRGLHHHRLVYQCERHRNHRYPRRDH